MDLLKEEMSAPATANAAAPDEETLDPDDWDALRRLGHRMVDEMFAYLETVRERPAWQPMPEEVQAALRAPLPQEAQPAEAVYEEFRQSA